MKIFDLDSPLMQFLYVYLFGRFALAEYFDLYLLHPHCYHWRLSDRYALYGVKNGEK